MRTVSWIVLVLVGAALLLGGFTSAFLAYQGQPRQDSFGTGGPTVQDLAEWRGDVATAVRARRGTAAAFAVGYGVLFLAVVLGPYRRGEVWSWWALLAATAALATVVLARVPLLGTRLGVTTGALLIGVVAVALALDLARLRRRPAA